MLGQMTHGNIFFGLTPGSRALVGSWDCGWGAERCAEMVEESSWIWYLIANYPGALGFALIMLLVVWTLPADGWALLAEISREHRKKNTVGRS